jgi:hypothetical protein
MTWIVSSNFLKPLSLDRWLVRDAKGRYASAAAYKTVVAGGVRFRSSPVNELGFGSGKVAFCATAYGSKEHISIPSHCFRLSFDGCNFRDPENNVVENCNEMYLLPDGNMFAAAAQAAESSPEDRLVAA